MILLTDEEMKKLEPARDGYTYYQEYGKAIAKEQLKRALIRIGKESKRMDGTIYLVPDYIKYRKALKEVGLK